MDNPLDGYSISLANNADLKEIWEMVTSVIKNMHSNGIMHYRLEYTKQEDFQKNIEKQELFLLKKNGKICATMCLSETDEMIAEYKEAGWHENNREKWLFLKRFMIDPTEQKKGLALKMLNFSDNYALSKGRTAIRLETHFGSVSVKVYNLYERHGYKLKKIIYVEKRRHYFALYEKVLDSPKL